MTRTFHVSLGYCPLSGNRGINQSQLFKLQLRSIEEKPESVHLVTVPHADPPHMEVVAQYDADDSAGAEWVQQALARAPELWQKLAERRKGVSRV